MILQTCRQGWHPLRKFVLEPSPPRGPQAAVCTEVWAVCPFCSRADFLFTYSVDTEGEGRHRRRPPTRRDYRAALSRFRKAQTTERKAKLKRSPA